MAGYVPPGWPTGVHPPGSEGFERTAVAWLLDVVPPDYRIYGVLRRHPVALAAMARHHLAACVEGARNGYRVARTELGDALPPHALDAVLATYRSEGRRLVATAAAADLIARALRGEEFVPRLREGEGGRTAASARPASPPPARARAAGTAATPARAAGTAATPARAAGTPLGRARPAGPAPAEVPPADPTPTPARPERTAAGRRPARTADAGRAPEPPMASPGGITRRPRPAARTHTTQAADPAGEARRREATGPGADTGRR